MLARSTGAPSRSILTVVFADLSPPACARLARQASKAKQMVAMMADVFILAFLCGDLIKLADANDQHSGRIGPNFEKANQLYLARS